MGKAKKRSKGSSGGDSGGATTTWDSAHHSLRQEQQANKRYKKQQQRQEEGEGEGEGKQPVKEDKHQVKEERRFKLTAKLTHDSREKREGAKLRLNITKTQREIETLRERLRKWDNAEEQERLDEEERKRKEPPKKKGRLGPESWKLKGAARPAWMVNEFDVRYECPHLKAHEKAREKAKRVQNLLILYKGKFGQQFADNDLSYPYRRQLLALLMQYGLLNKEAKKYKTARTALLECLDLDGIQHPITNARCHLMRLYLQVNRPQSVHELWNTRLSAAGNQETSVWVLYSVALVEYIRWNDFGESTRQQAEQALLRAFAGNPLCAYYLAFADFFHQYMEYTDDIEDADDPLGQAIEYCHDEQMGMWMGTEGALQWVQDTLLRAKADFDWNRRLEMIEAEQKANGEDDQNGEEEDEEESQEDQADLLMFVGMFRTTMEMLEANGSLARVPPAIVEDAKDNNQQSEGQEKKDQESEEGEGSPDDSD
ncbi:expressed unknown protein [Seminavis robusta]|uniref:Uncharacterized protein n=1 Tax=Seminavis robusta TaxID=568900 RepID=A0A9N8HIW8_9STRA|nr:expressed unknown protein [Seminavis robusta]|eukprot:Sro523_g159740.1 n/a (484) ;mRNA; f:22230-23681